MQGDRTPGEALTIGYIMMALHAERQPLDNVTAAFTHLVSAFQMEDGSWLGNGVSRPPIEDSTVSHTAMAVRVLTLYPIPGLAKRLEENLRRAQGWLLAVKPRSAEERNMRLMGLVWSKAARSDIDAAANEVLAQQRPGGGWSQLPQLEPDAYATGSSLYALRQAGIQPDDQRYRNGVRFLAEESVSEWRVVGEDAVISNAALLRERLSVWPESMDLGTGFRMGFAGDHGDVAR